ncbi:MAG: TauD/TfdA dioxygenase family protein [Vicinamibacterales bacterium]
MVASTPASTTAIEIRPFDGPLGARVHCDDLARLDSGALQQIRTAWLEHLVLLIRGQQLSPDGLVKFAEIFGEVSTATPVSELPPGVGADRPNPYIAIVSNVKIDGAPIGTLGDGEVVWHTDMSYHEEPISASMLYAIETPPSGGRTGFINMYEAYDRLPSDLRAVVAGLTIKNDATYNSAGQLRRNMQPATDVRTSPGVDHPALRTHPETGCHALYLGRRPNAYVQGLDVSASEALLDELWSKATALRPWVHEWQPGDLVIWDNRCVMHRREPFDPASRRVMHRAQCKGDRPSYNPQLEGDGVHSRHRLASAVAA